MLIDRWFPTVIAREECPFWPNEKNDCMSYLDNLNNPIIDTGIQKDLHGNKYHNIHKMDKFKKLSDWVTSCVNQYAKLHLFPDNYKCVASWGLDYKKYSSQPFHSHKGSTISCIFYAVSNENDANTIFKSPINDMKNPQRIGVDKKLTSELYNEFTEPTCYYKPIEGTLLIFRSYVEHSTDIKDNEDRRYVISFDYDYEN